MIDLKCSCNCPINLFITGGDNLQPTVRLHCLIATLQINNQSESKIQQFMHLSHLRKL